MKEKAFDYIKGYSIIFDYLDNYWERTKSDELGGLLGSMDRKLFTDGKPADQSLLSNWAHITNERANLTLDECFNYMIHFVEKQCQWLDLQNLVNDLKQKRSEELSKFKALSEGVI